MTMKYRISIAALIAGLGGALAGCATTGELSSARSDTLSLGRNGAGEPCQAARDWRDPVVPGMFDESYAINCRNVAASRALGFVRAVETGARGPVDSTISCGAASLVTLPKLGKASAKRCFDTALGAESIAIEVTRGNRVYLASAAPSILGPTEEALRIIVGEQSLGADPRRDTTSAIVVDTLAPVPAAPAPRQTGRSARNPQRGRRRADTCKYNRPSPAGVSPVNGVKMPLRLPALRANLAPAVRRRRMARGGYADRRRA